MALRGRLGGFSGRFAGSFKAVQRCFKTFQCVSEILGCFKISQRSSREFYRVSGGSIAVLEGFKCTSKPFRGFQRDFRMTHRLSRELWAASERFRGIQDITRRSAGFR